MKLGVVLVGILPALLVAESAQAQTTAEFRQRCATRLSATLLGKSPSSTLLAATDPQQSVDAMLQSADFIDRFSRYINASYNPDPGETPAEDATYFLARHILQNGRPWKEMFIGPYRVDPGSTATADAVVVNDTNGLGYFRSPTWMRRYAGNELEGYRLTAAYRMINNVLGVKLLAAQNTEGVDAAGRQSAACAGCHYNPLFGLDLIAKILSKRGGTATNITFIAPNEGPQMLLGGKTISNDKDFITAMVDSVDFRFNACRTALQFLYARTEVQCEGPVFDKCMAAFAADGKIQSAIAAVAKDATFCQ